MDLPLYHKNLFTIKIQKMKTSKILLMADKSNNEETPKKVRAGQLLKSILVLYVIMDDPSDLVCCLYSCSGT
jgi:hypothetical protein